MDSYWFDVDGRPVPEEASSVWASPSSFRHYLLPGAAARIIPDGGGGA
jgi:hypothetical protein